jgi:hypothetical protein
MISDPNGRASSSLFCTFVFEKNEKPYKEWFLVEVKGQ